MEDKKWINRTMRFDVETMRNVKAIASLKGITLYEAIDKALNGYIKAYKEE